MSFFNQFLCLIMYKIGYLIITPKSYSFGGFYLTIIGSEKIINLKKKKNFFVYLFLNLQEKNSLINEVDHSILNHSKTTNNVVIFKKIYCSKTKKLFKLNKLFDKNIFSFETLKNSIDNGTVYMEENSEEEILEGMIEFYEINFKNKKKLYIE